jgi:FG-GAP-like repeat/FG-GAP repeat
MRRRICVAGLVAVSTAVAATSAQGLVYFSEGSAYPIGSMMQSGSATSIAVADLNHDSRDDVVVGNQHSGNVSVLIGNGDGTLAGAVNVASAVGSSPRDVATGDFVEDGDPDIIVSNGDGRVSVLAGHGDGTFDAPATTTATVSGSSGPLAVGDLNVDGHEDVAVNICPVSGFALLLGKGNGSFDPPVIWADLSFGCPGSLAFADFNDDGFDEIVAAVPSADIYVVPGRADETLVTPTHPFSGSQILDRIGTGRFDANATVDLGFAFRFTGVAGALLGNGDGTFKPPMSGQLVGLTFGSTAVGDLDDEAWTTPCSRSTTRCTTYIRTWPPS